jgi:hypothetical protein
MHYEAKRWTEDEIALLKQRKAEGVKTKVIAFELSRSEVSVAERWRWMNSSEEIKERRRLVRQNYAAGIINRATPKVVPDDVLIERDRRLAAPITINALILGDPRPGFSALDRRAAQ